MLIVPAFQLGDPVLLVIEMKADDAFFHEFVKKFAKSAMKPVSFTQYMSYII